MMHYLIKECQEIYDFLIDYQEGELPILERLRFGMHLWSCPNCLKYMKSYKGSSEIFRSALAEDPPPEALMEMTLEFIRNRRGKDGG